MKLKIGMFFATFIAAILSSGVLAAGLPVEAPDVVPQQVTIYTVSAVKPKLLKQLLSSEQMIAALESAGCVRTQPRKPIGSSVSYSCSMDDGDQEKALKSLLLPGTSLTTKTIVQFAASTCPSGCAYIKTCCNNVSYCCCKTSAPTQRCTGYNCP